MFISTDRGGTVILWDTNLFEPAFSFCIPNSSSNRNSNRHTTTTAASPSSNIKSAALPKSPTSQHLLLAVGSTNNPTVRLCDITSGSHSHQLTGLIFVFFTKYPSLAPTTSPTTTSTPSWVPSVPPFTSPSPYQHPSPCLRTRRPSLASV